MKYREALVYKSDFERVQSVQTSVKERKYGLKKFYEPGYETYAQTPTAIAAMCASQLTDYVVSSFLPTSGAWINFGAPVEKDLELASQMQYRMAEYFNQSNFYAEMQKTVFNTLVYGSSLMSIDYSGGGFSFNCIDDDEIYVSDDSNIRNCRVYVKKEMTGLDIKSKFKNPPAGIFVDANGRTIEDADYSMYSVVIGYVPDTEAFFKESTGVGYRIVYFMMDSRCNEILDPIEEEKPFHCLPIAKFSSDKKHGSLGDMALPLIIQLENYELRLSEYANNVTNPPREVDEEVLINGQANYGAGGLVPLSKQARNSKAVELAGNLPYGIEDKKMLEARIREVFKVDLINQAKIQGMSSLHVAGLKLNAIESICPLIDSIFTKTLRSVLERCHSVLMIEDKDYRIMSNKSKGVLAPTGLEGYKKSLENIVATGRFMQTAAPFLQADPQSAIVLNVEDRLRNLAWELGLDDLIKSREEIQEERQAMAQQQMQAQQMEQHQMAAETAKTASEIEGGGGEGQG